MSNFAISVENIGKKYHIGGVQTKYHTIRDTVAKLVGHHVLDAGAGGAHQVDVQGHGAGA